MFRESCFTTLNLVSGVVHAVSYSLLLLNTDLHVAELTSRMSRGQFVRNTLAAIQSQLQPGSSSDLTFDDWSSVRGGSDVSDPPPHGRTIKRSDSITSWNSVTREAIASGLGGKAPSTGQLTIASTDTANTPALTPANESAVSVASTHNEVKTPENGSTPMVFDRNWESEMENMLKVGARTRQVDVYWLIPGNLVGDLHLREEPTNPSAHWLHAHGACFDVLTKPVWHGAQEPQPPHQPVRQARILQAGQYPWRAIDLDRTRRT